MNYLRIPTLAVLLVLAAACSDTTAEDANNGHNNGANNGLNNGHNNGANNGHNNGAEPEACWEWQRFHMHPGGNQATVVEGADGQYTISNVRFVHGGSWELHFHVAKGDQSDTVLGLFCVDGELPFAECFDEDATNDEGCENAVDVSCRGDELAVGDEVHGAGGHFKAVVVSTTPDPTVAIDASSVTIQLQTMDGTPVGGATITQDPACGAAEGMHGGHDD
jgi:hypothetical protein